MLMPVETFKTPVNTEIRLYKIAGNYYVPERDVLAACGYKQDRQNGGYKNNRVYDALRENRDEKNLKRIFKGRSHSAFVILCDNVVPTLQMVLEEPAKSWTAKKWAEHYDPIIKSVIELFKKEILPYVELMKTEENDAIENVAYAIGSEKPKEEGPTLFAQKFFDDKDAEIAELKAKIAKLENSLSPDSKEKLKPTFRKRLAELFAADESKKTDVIESLQMKATTVNGYLYGPNCPSLINAAKLADYFNVSLDWLCGRDEYVKR